MKRMAKFLLAKKLGMTQAFEEDGTAVPVTVMEAGPCTVLQIRTGERDGYQALQVGFEPLKKPRRQKKFRWVREVRCDGDQAAELPKPGDLLRADQFQAGDTVHVSGTTKGRGFQGVVKRHGFSGGPASHGHRHVLRTPGSIGSRFPQGTLRGLRSAGRMGGERRTVKNLRVARVDPDANIIAIHGAVPGPKGMLLEIRGE